MKTQKQILAVLAAVATLMAVASGGLGYNDSRSSSDGKTLADDKGSKRPVWLTDYEEARKMAKETGRPILINFSGSDWCGWCIRLDNEVLAKAEFKSYAKDHLVLFIADFPRSTRLPQKVVAQNEQLARRFEVQGFPTVLLVEADNSVIARTGYQRGGADAYVRHLKALIAGRRNTVKGD